MEGMPDTDRFAENFFVMIHWLETMLLRSKEFSSRLRISFSSVRGKYQPVFHRISNLCNISFLVAMSITYLITYLEKLSLPLSIVSSLSTSNYPES